MAARRPPAPSGHDLPVADLAVSILAEHSACRSAVESALDHARRAGELLAEAKRRLPHGSFLPWVATRCQGLSVRSAQNYMKIARSWAQIEAKAQHDARLPLRLALALLSEPTSKTVGESRLRDEALAALPVDSGMSGEGWVVLHADFAAVDTVLPGSADVVLTDPPWGDVPICGQLARRADEWLRPGGSLVAQVGTARLPEVLSLLGNHLSYQWLLALVSHPCGGRTPQFDRRVYQTWHAAAWYVKGEYSGPQMRDTIQLGPGDWKKDLHPWQQPEAAYQKLVEKFTRPGDLVVDPCLGSGTTGVAAVRLGRRFIGIEVDKATATIAARRLHRASEESRVTTCESMEASLA